jgi:hypothetical protein
MSQIIKRLLVYSLPYHLLTSPPPCQRRGWGVVAAIWAIIGLLIPLQAHSQSNPVTLERVVYLTGNLDSLTRSYIDGGFAIERSEFEPFGTVRNVIRLPSGQTVELQSMSSMDTDDWRRNAITWYGTHVGGVVFGVYNAARLLLKFDSLGIPHGPLITSHYGEKLAFGLKGPEPLDVSFISDDSVMPQHTEAIPPNRFRRISWLLLTASPDEEHLLRSVFDALDLRKLHEGCCDYWLLGSPEYPVAIRFELPSTTFAGKGNWLSIENGGVIYAY